MSITSKSLLLIAAIAMAGCTNQAGLFGAPPSDTGAGSGTFDPALGDPTSPAYFSNAVGDRVLFEVDQSDLTAEGRTVLSRQATWLLDNGSYTAVVEGHADEQGTREYNLALGARRASTVRDFLVSQGVADNRLETVTFGKERPIAICSDESCYSQNRRAVTVLNAGGAGF